MKRCALCGIEAELKLSHIFPKFATNWIKRTAFTGKLTDSDNPNARRQDGKKMRLLCGSCEQRFSVRENLYSKNIFTPFLDNNKSEFHYSSWLNYFITSVNWRVLYLFLLDCLTRNYQISPYKMSILSEIANKLANYLLEISSFPEGITNQLHFLDKKIFLNVAELYPMFFIRRSCTGSVIESMNYIYIYSNICGMFLVTEIKPANFSVWKNTKVNIDEGKISTDQFALSPAHEDLIYTIIQCSKSELPKYKSEKILYEIDKNRDKINGGNNLQALNEDFILKSILGIMKTNRKDG